MILDFASGSLLAALGAVATLGTWVVYWRQIQWVRVPAADRSPSCDGRRHRVGDLLLKNAKP